MFKEKEMKTKGSVVAKVIGKGRPAREVFEEARKVNDGIPSLSEMQGIPGREVAGFVLAVAMGFKPNNGWSEFPGINPSLGVPGFNIVVRFVRLASGSTLETKPKLEVVPINDLTREGI